MDDGEEHIQVSDELAALGQVAWGDSLALASKPDRKKVGEEARAADAGLAWACCGMQGWRESMEDASLMMPAGYIGGNFRDASIFGVYDGHGGEQVARFIVRQLPMVLGKLRTQDPELALTQAYRRIDELLSLPSAAAELRELTIPGNEVRESAEGTGATAVTCLILGSKMVLANAGDSRAVLCKKGKAVDLTEDHKPVNALERARIEAAGGWLEEEPLSTGGIGYRVNGNLNLSRALGDLRYKDAAMPPEQHVISGVPDIHTLTWSVPEDEFVLIGCDGLWECMSSQQAINFVRSRLPPPGHTGGKRGLLPVLEALVDACCANHPMQNGGLGCDNITAVLIRFEDPAAVAAAVAEADHPEEEEEVVSEAQARQKEAATRQLIERLSERRWQKKESLEERQERQKREKEELIEQEAREKEEIKQREIRRKRKEERELLESKTKKRLKCCAAVESEEDDGDDDWP